MSHQLPKIGEPGQNFTGIANMIRFKNQGFFKPNLFFMAFRLKYGVFLNRFQIKATQIQQASTTLNGRTAHDIAPSAPERRHPPRPTIRSQRHKIMLKMPCGYQEAISQ